MEGDERNSGSTATTLLVREDRVIVANVGDSRAVLGRGSQAIDLTTEHRVFGRGPAVQAESSRVKEVGGCPVIAVHAEGFSMQRRFISMATGACCIASNPLLTGPPPLSDAPFPCRLAGGLMMGVFAGSSL